MSLLGLAVYLGFRKKKIEPLPVFEKPQDFIVWFKTQTNFMKELGVDTRGVIAQAAIETGWGKHLPTDSKTGRVSLNFFGIKWYDGYPTDYVTCITKEYDSEKQTYYPVTARFRAYKTVREGLEDYLSLIQRKYQKAWEGRGNYKTFIDGIASGGWATSISYKENILSIVEKYLL